LFGEAVRAVHRAFPGRLERYFGLFAAGSAGHLVHLSGATALCFVGGAAGGAALGLVLKALLLIEFLLTGSEGEGLPAVLAGQGLVLETHGSPWILGFSVPKKPRTGNNRYGA